MSQNCTREIQPELGTQTNMITLVCVSAGANFTKGWGKIQTPEMTFYPHISFSEIDLIL